MASNPATIPSAEMDEEAFANYLKLPASERPG